jgi:RND family efflux transporter MFP subunit
MNYRSILAMAALASLCAAGPAWPQEPAAAARTVEERDVDDLKAVFATVRSRDRIDARVRTPGTVASLKVVQGTPVEAGQVLAVVADPKIALKIKALDAQIVAIGSRLATAKAELERSEALKSRGVAPQARVDQAQTAFDVARNDLKAAEAELSVVRTQITEGEVLAPASGRVLQVPVTEGSVVMPGESIATIAANGYLLRLEIPERHARFIKVGDSITLGERGLSDDQASRVPGKITKVYPELSDGRVVADAEVPDLGSYFVGERVQVLISVGRRKAIVIPEAFVFSRYGLDYVRVATSAGYEDVVVQTGQKIAPSQEPSIEVLSGLANGEKVVMP